MRLRICAVGRLRAGPEQLLVEDYLARLSATGRAIGFPSASLAEVEERKRLEGAALMTREAELLLAHIPPGARVIALDERGRNEGSEAFAARLGAWRDEGAPEAVFLIGGANGLAPEIRERADHLMSFGKMTWPHMLARVMLTEQLYRSVTILAGHPYHRA